MSRRVDPALLERVTRQPFQDERPRQWEIWKVDDHAVDFTDSPAAYRTPHTDRWAVVAQASSVSAAPNCRSVQILPCSSQVKRAQHPLTVVVESAPDGFAKRSAVIVHLIQPIKIESLKERMGRLQARDVVAVRRSLARLFDLDHQDARYERAKALPPPGGKHRA